MGPARQSRSLPPGHPPPSGKLELIQSVLHIGRPLVKGVIVLIVLGVLVFLGLTRTQVGRDELRNRLEREFAARFDGSLHIGSLKGNLLNDLFASDVRLLDRHGHTILSADSLVLRPHWRDLFSRKISVGSVTLFHPQLSLVRDSGGVWNLADVFSREAPAEGNPWTLSSTDIRLIDGRVSIQNDGERPKAVRDGHVFDYTNTRIEALDLRASVEWTPSLKNIDVFHLTAFDPTRDFRIETLTGQLLIEENRTAWNAVELQTEGSHLALSGSIGPWQPASPFTERPVELVVRPSRLTFDELKPFIPVLPLSDTLKVAFRASGTPADLAIESLHLERGGSRLTGSGALVDLPDRLDFRLTLDPSTVASDDLLALLPDSLTPDFGSLGAVDVTLRSEGTIPLSNSDPVPLRLSAHVSASSVGGSVQGQVDVAGNDSLTLVYTADLRVDSLDLSRVLHNPDLRSRLNGWIEVAAGGRSLREIEGTARLTLGRSVLSGRPFDNLLVDATARNGHLIATGHASHGDGSVRVEADATFDTDRPVFALALESEHLNLGPLLLRDDLTTDLNASLTLEGSGLRGDELAGEATISFDSSTIALGDVTRVLPSLSSRLTFNPPGSGSPLLVLGGDFADAVIETDARYGTVLAVIELWTDALSSAVKNEIAKPLVRPYGEPGRTLAETVFPPSLDQFRLRRNARANLAADAIDSVFTVESSITLKRSDLLAPLLGLSEPIGTDLSLDLRVVANADDLSLSGLVTADSFTVGATRLDSIETRIDLTANLDAPLRETLNLSLDAFSGRLQIAGRKVESPLVTLDYRDRKAIAEISTRPQSGQAAFRGSFALDLLSDRNRLTVRDAFLGMNNNFWTSGRNQVIDLFEDAVVVRDLTLVSNVIGETGSQVLRAHGVISETPGDTLFVEADRIRLRGLSDFVSTRYPLGGRLDARIALAGGLFAPELTGRVHVDALSLGDRFLGELEVESHYVTGTPDIALEAVLRPLPETVTATMPDLSPEENHLRIGGTFRLPRFDRESDRIYGSELDLTLSAERADLFFFEFIFPTILTDVTGYATGEGTIRGEFTNPIFDVQAEVVDGSFRIPAYNLKYTVEGTAHVDREGIKIREARLADGSGGTGLVTGALYFNNWEYLSFDLSGNLQNVQIIDVTDSRDLAFYGNIRASGSVTLTGPVYQALLRSPDVMTSPDSEIFIPLTAAETVIDPGYIIFADSTGEIPDLSQLDRRENMLATRPVGERRFVEGLDMDLNIYAPPGTTVHLVIDPLLGDAMNAVGTGRIQLQRTEGEFYTFGSLEVSSGDYLFSAGDVFFRRFLIDSGSITWDGSPVDAQLNIQASYRTRASRAGLPGESATSSSLIPLIVRLNVTGRVSAPAVELGLAVDRRNRDILGGFSYEGLETILNDPERATEYATSVLLTNTFLLTASSLAAPDAERGGSTRNQFAFTSLSQLVTSQINRYLNQALPNVDLTFGLQGERAQDLDVTYGVALRLLDERLVIRGQGVYQAEQEARNRGEFVVEIRLSPAISVEVFYRREGDIISDATLTNTTGAGLSYQTEFTTWRRLLHQIIRGSEREEEDGI